MLRQKSVIPPEREEELEKMAYEALEDELNHTQQRVLPLQTSLSLRTSAQGIEAAMLLLPERTTSMASLVELASIQGSGRDSSSGEQEDQVSQLKHEVFVFKAAAKQLGLLLMLRNKEIEALLQEVDFSLRDDQADGESMDIGGWRRRAADAIQEIHETFNQESQNLGQVNMLPLVSSLPQQDSSTAEHITPISIESASEPPADFAESPKASPSLVSQPQMPDAAPSMLEGAASSAVFDENPLSLQLFVVSNEATNTSPDLAVGHTSKSFERRRSSGVRRTLLAHLQLRSAHLEQQLAASREECAAISNGLLEALSAVSHRPTQDHPTDAAQQTLDSRVPAHLEVPRKPNQERVHALQERCTRLELQNAELEEAHLQAKARCAALGRQLTDAGDVLEQLGAAKAAKNAISMEADLLRERVQLLEARCKLLATELDDLHEALGHAQQQVLPLQSYNAEQQRLARRSASGDCLNLPAELQESIPEAAPLADKDVHSEANTTLSSSTSTSLQCGEAQHTSLLPATEDDITQLEHEEHIRPVLPGQSPTGNASHGSQSGEARVTAAEEVTMASPLPPWATAAYPYLDVESVLAMEAFYIAEQASMCLNVPTFAHEYTPLPPAYQIDHDAHPSSTLPPAQEEKRLRGPGAAPAPVNEEFIALQRQMVAEKVGLLAELECSRQEAWSAVQGHEKCAWLLQQAYKESNILRSAVQELDEGLRQQISTHGLQETSAATMAAEQTSKQLALIGQIDSLAAEKLGLQQQLAESVQREAAAVDRAERSEFLQEACAEQLRCMQGTVNVLEEAMHESGLHLQETQRTVLEQQAGIATHEVHLAEEEGHASELLELVVREEAAQNSLRLQISTLDEEISALQDEATVQHDRSVMQLAAALRELHAERVDRSEQEAAMMDHFSSQLASCNAMIHLLRQALSEADAGRQESSAMVANQTAAVTQLSSEVTAADEYGAALSHHVVAVEAVYTGLIGRLCAAEEEIERLRDELLLGKDGGRRSARGTGEMVTWRPHGGSLDAALAGAAALRMQLADSEECRNTLQAQLFDLTGSTSASSAVATPLQDKARESSGVPVHTLHQGQVLYSYPDVQSLQQELAEVPSTSPGTRLAAAASQTAELRDAIDGTGDQPIQALAGGPDADSMRRDLARALADSQKASARCKILTAQLKDLEACRETLQAQVMDMAAAGITRERQPEAPALHQTYSVAGPDAHDTVNSPATAEMAMTALAAGALVTALQAQLAESEQLRVALEARLMHAAEQSPASSLGPVYPKELTEQAQKVDSAGNEPTIKAYYGGTFGGVVVTPAVVSTSEKLEAARSTAAKADMENGAVGIAPASVLFEDEMGPAQYFEAISLEGEVEPADDRHFGHNLLPINKMASPELAAIDLGDGLNERLFCQFGDDTGAAQIFEAIDLSGEVEVVDDRHFAILPHDVADPTEVPAADWCVEDGANLQLQDGPIHDAEQPADEEGPNHTGKQLADAEEEVRVLQTALSQSEAIFVEVELQLRRALEQEARLEQGWAAAEERLRAAQRSAADAEAVQSTLQKQLLAQHDRSASLEAQLASAAPVQLVIRCQEPAQEVVQVVIMCQEKTQDVVHPVDWCQEQPQDGTPLDGQPLPDSCTLAAMDAAAISVPEASGDLYQPAQEKTPLNRQAFHVLPAGQPVIATAAIASGDSHLETLEVEAPVTERRLPQSDGLAATQPLRAAVDEDSRQRREWLEQRPVILQFTVQAGPQSPQAWPQPTFADAGSNTGKEETLPGIEAGILHLAPPSCAVQRALSMEPEGKSAAIAAGTHDGRDAAANPVAIEAPAQHRMDTFAVLCSDVFETRADMAEAADEGVQHISENPLFMLSRVTDDAPMPAAGLIAVQTPDDITSCTAAADVRQEFTQSPVPHMKGTHETDLHGKYMSDTHETATSDDITEGASATDADGMPSPEPSVKGDMQAADDDDVESGHQETLRGQQAQSIAKRIRESWAALRQEQQATMADGSVQQEMQPALVQGRISVGYDGRGPSIKALAQRGAPGRLQAHEADSEDMTDVIYANWCSVAGAPDNPRMQRESGQWGDSHLSQRCAELERALKAAALRVTSLEGDATAAANHISTLQAQKAALAAKLARAKQQRAASAGQAGEGAELQRATLRATGEDGVSVGPDEVAQQIGSPEGTSVILLLSGAQSAEGQCDTSEAGATRASAQAAGAFGGIVNTSMDSNEVELAGSTTRSEAADMFNRRQILSDDFVDEEQRVALQITTENHMKSLQAAADSAGVIVHLESHIEGAPRSITASLDSALDAYTSGPSSAKRVHDDDEVLAMSTAQGSPETTPMSKGILDVAEELAGEPSGALRCAELAQQTEALHAKITAAIARIRMLEAEKALAARALATVSTAATTEVEDNRAAEDVSDGCSESSSLDTSGLLTLPQELSSPRQSIPPVSKAGSGSRHSWAGAGQELGASSRAAGPGAGTDGKGQRATWNPAVQASPSFNRLQQMARTISELQAEVALWKRSSQGAHLEMKKLFRSLKEKGTIISRLESQLSCSRF